MQNQAEGSCLRFPEHIAPQREVTYEMAINMLLKGAGMAPNVPFSWSYVDKPADGTVMLLYLPASSPFPNDGIRWQDNEIKGNMAAGGIRELEAHEIKFGFIPGSGESSASRVRRRYRLTKGGNPELLLVHYTRGPQTVIQPQLLNQPVRAYPLRPINEPSVYIAGEKRGLKADAGSSGGGVRPQPPIPAHPGPSGMGNMSGGMPPTGGMGMGGGGPGGLGVGPGGSGGGGMPINMGNMSIQQQQAMLAQQNNQMEQLERRRERERQAAAAQAHQQGRLPLSRAEEEDSGDEVDQISTRSLALARYKRNHDWMNDVFHQAAFGRVIPTHDILGYAEKPKTFSTLFDKDEVDDKVEKLQAEIGILQEGVEKRRAEKIRKSQSEETGGILTSTGSREGMVV